MLDTYTVTFVDYNGTQLSKQTISHGNGATAPTSPTRTGYTFTDWDKVFNEVTGDLTVTAQYEINTYTVTFVDYNETQLSQQTVNYGSGATVPMSPTRTGYTFTSWDKAFDNVTGDLTVTAVYEIHTYTITFIDYNGTQLSQQTVNYGNGATAPTSPTRTGYTFVSWDKAFNNVTGNLTVTAQYEINTYTVTFSASANGTITATVDGSAITTGAAVEYGKSVIFTATPDSGYKVSGWTLNGTAVSGNTTNTYTLANVSATTTVTVSFVKTVSILESDRVIPQSEPDKTITVVAPVSQLTGEFTAGPNPTVKQSGMVNFYRQGKHMTACELRIYDVTGNIINKVKIKDNAIATQSRRKVGTWDLCDRTGRIVSAGTYLVRGIIKLPNGNKEKISVILSVR
jgi:hypothetical protein